VKSNFKPINALLGENDVMLPLIAQHRHLSRLHKIFADTLPPGWKTLCRVAALEGSTVVIAAANGAIATNLKADSPRLLTELKDKLKLGRNEKVGVGNDAKTAHLNKKLKQEQEVTAIRVVVQPEISTWRPPTPTSVRLATQKAAASEAQLADLSTQLADSPLKTAVERVRKQRQAESKQALTKRR
jgi:hypothetical protein